MSERVRVWGVRVFVRLWMMWYGYAGVGGSGNERRCVCEGVGDACEGENQCEQHGGGGDERASESGCVGWEMD